MSWIGRFLGARAGRSFTSEASELVDETLLLGDELARWKADSELLHALQETVLPAALVLGAIMLANPLITWLGGGLEAHRVVIGAMALAGFSWASWISLQGLAWFLRHLRMMLITGLAPRPYLRLLISLTARDWLRDQTAGIGSSRARAFLQSFQVETGHRNERLAARLADQIGATLWRHVALRLGYLLAPMFVALIYYRLVVYPSFLGASAWLTMLYPLAWLSDLVLGTGFRAELF